MTGLGLPQDRPSNTWHLRSQAAILFVLESISARVRIPLHRPKLGGKENLEMAGVTLDHITKKYGEVTAVNDLNIQIRDQEFLVLVGPSGCGKSTALRMIAGLEEITGGDLYIGDRRVNDVAPKDRDIAMVFQSYALYPHMSVYDNMAFGLKLRKRPKQEIDRRVKEAGELLGRRPCCRRPTCAGRARSSGTPWR